MGLGVTMKGGRVGCRVRVWGLGFGWVWGLQVGFRVGSKVKVAFDKLLFVVLMGRNDKPERIHTWSVWRW